MKHLFLSLIFLALPNVCFAQSWSIYFDNSSGEPVVESELYIPEGMGYILIYNGETKKGVINFSRNDRHYSPYPLYDYSRHPCYGGRYRAY
jgi:hypothetical protein